MAYLIEEEYVCDKLNQDIHQYISKCQVCNQAGKLITNTKNNIIHTTRPNEMWQVDLIGPLSKNGNFNYILVCVDHFTKWAETAMLKGKNADKITNCIEHLIIRKHGIPSQIYSDNGTEFKNSQCEDIANKYNFIWKFKSPYHHKSTGLVERTNQSIMNKLKKLTQFGKQDWHLFLSKATYAYNIINTQLLKRHLSVLNMDPRQTSRLTLVCAHLNTHMILVT